MPGLGANSTPRCDVLVVGLGAMGAATAYHARREGLNVVGVDRHHPPHLFGSTHAETRITRLAVGEGPQYLPLVARSHEIWRDLERRSSQALLHQCGGLIIADPASTADKRWGDFVTRTDAIATDAGLDFQIIDANAALTLHPALRGLEQARIGYEPTAGLIGCDEAVRVQLELAHGDGADLRFNESVVAVEPDDAGVDVTTDRGRYRADHVVLAAGPWMPDLVAPVDAAHLTVTRQVVFWFEVDDVSAFASDVVPFVMWIGNTIDDYLAVFPIAPGMTRAVKVLGEQFAEPTDARTVDRTVTAAETARFRRRNVEPHVAGLSDRCVRADVCLYTNTPDDHFLIDTAPDSDRVTVLSACSGHGFKHSAAIGEAVAQRLTSGTSMLDLEPFSRQRLAGAV